MAGWIKLHRKIIDSDIYIMPPLYLRVFERLILEANHKNAHIPYKESSSKVTGKKLIKRGERLTSVRDICRWVGWYERGKFKIPNPKTIQNILDWLEENNMIYIYGEKGNRKETHYKIVNYNDYQKQDNQEVTEKKQESNGKVTVAGDKQECIKNVKNDKEDIYILTEDEKQFLETLNKVENYPLDRKKDLEMYKTLGERYPQLNLAEAIEQWRMYKLDRPLKPNSNPRSQINTAFKKYIEWGKCLKKGGISIGQYRTSSKGASEETLRLERIAKEQGLIGADGTIEEPEQVDF